MQSNEFEAAFGQLLEQAAYDDAEDALFALVRAAFQAGWRAAGGDCGNSMRIFSVLRPEDDDRSRPRRRSKQNTPAD